MAKHRCEAKNYTQVRAFDKMGTGYINRTTRCKSTDTIHHVRNPKCTLWERWDAGSVIPLPTEAWFCQEHKHDQRRGVTKWIPEE